MTIYEMNLEIARLNESNRVLSKQYIAMSKTSAEAASENRKLRERVAELEKQLFPLNGRVTLTESEQSK